MMTADCAECLTLVPSPPEGMIYSDLDGTLVDWASLWAAGERAIGLEPSATGPRMWEVDQYYCMTGSQQNAFWSAIWSCDPPLYPDAEWFLNTYGDRVEIGTVRNQPAAVEAAWRLPEVITKRLHVFGSAREKYEWAFKREFDVWIDDNLTWCNLAGRRGISSVWLRDQPYNQACPASRFWTRFRSMWEIVA